MIVRWSLYLAMALGFIAVSVAVMFWLSDTIVSAEHEVRRARMQQQELEQQLSSLRAPGNAHHIRYLEQDINDLQIALVEILTETPRPRGVLSLDYEQRVIPQVLTASDGSGVAIVRVMLDLSVQHSAALLAMLGRINESIPTWPHETRACDLQRNPLKGLVAQCSVDFYHWSAADSHVLSAGKQLQ